MGHLLAISDLHLGQPFNLGAFSAFLKDLRHRVRPDMLLLLGDVLELAWFKWPQLEAQKLCRDSMDELRGFADSIETLLIPGNHDPYEAIPQDAVSPIQVVAPAFIPHALAPPLLDIDNIVFTHGHSYDVTTHIWSKLLKLPIKGLLPWLYIRLYGTPYEVKMARREQDYREYVGWIMGRAMMDALRHGRDLCFGHTHAPMVLDLGGRVIVNAGDWRDSLSYIEARDGKMSLHFWRP